MISAITVVRLLLLSHLWTAPVSSSEGMLRGDRSRSRDLADDDGHTPRNNSTGTDVHRNLTLFGGMEPRVIGGKKAQEGRYSYQVALVDSKGLFCGGVLICKDMVLTAAHCGSDRNSPQFFVGSEYLSDRFGDRYGETASPKTGWIHDDYDWLTMENDFMVYQLTEPVAVDVEVVELNDDPNLPSRSGDQLIVLGWGDTNPNPGSNAFQTSDELLEVGVKYIPNDQCKERTGYVGNDFVGFQSAITDKMLCALDRGKDGCQGDSGGPIIKEGNDPRGRSDKLVGLSSWGVACAHDSLPGVYARISSQYEWIKSIVCDNSLVPASSFNCRVSGNKPSTGVGNNNNGKDIGGKQGGKKGKGKGKGKGNAKAKRKKKARKKKKKNKNKGKKKQKIVHRHELFS